MGKIELTMMGVAGWLLLASASLAQSQDPASPRSGNGERGRELLTILGPRPAGGFSPLQQQELTRRVRCAATREQIQDELDVEAAGVTSSLYVMSELRMLEKENCAPVPLLPGMAPAAPAPAPVPQAAQAPSWQPPPITNAATPPPPPAAAKPVASTTRPAPPPAPPAAAPAAQIAAAVKPAPQPQGPAYTPGPEYPPEEMAAKHQGEVLVQLVMNADGSVRDASVAKSCGYPALDEAALKVTRTWRIPAAAGDGRVIKVPLTFTAQ